LQSLCLQQKGRLFCFCTRHDEGPHEQVVSIANTAAVNGSDLGDGIAIFTQVHSHSITPNEVYAHAGVLGQGDVGRIGVESEGVLQKYQIPC
jgi:hypothetical protein